MLQGRQRVSDPTNPVPLVATPVEWLADVLFNPAKADSYPTFRLSATDSARAAHAHGADRRGNQDRLHRPGHAHARRRRLRAGHPHPLLIQPAPAKLAELERQAQLAEPVDASSAPASKRPSSSCAERIILYQRLKHSVQLPDSPAFLTEIVQFQQSLPPASPPSVPARRARRTTRPPSRPCSPPRSAMTTWANSAIC